MTVDDYIALIPEPQRAVAEAARKMIDAALEGGEAAIRWAHPTWSLGKTPICYLRAASTHITLGFWRGAWIDDPSGRLEPFGQAIAHVKLRSEGDLDRKLFANWLRQARALEG